MSFSVHMHDLRCTPLDGERYRIGTWHATLAAALATGAGVARGAVP